jgi:large subunit ribosomal protein L24e
MVTCAFSGKQIPPGQGIMLVKNDGRIYHFASRKAEKNMIKLGRNPRRTRWTAEYHRIKKGNVKTA